MYDVTRIREQFPALAREEQGVPVAYFDGPAGSQVPLRVSDAMVDYLLKHNANRGACFGTSHETDRLLESAHLALADFVGATDPCEIAFGQNMTSLTFAMSRAIARTWQSGDEVIVSRLDHDANVTPWVLAARDAGAVVRYIDIKLEDCTLDLDSFHSQLNERTRLVAVGYASNATGTINPVHEICTAARTVGATTFVDAVHYAPHGRINVAQIDCDLLACSAYKFFGPHIGVMWGRQDLLNSLAPYKLRPSPNSLPGRWMTGTQSHEAICGAAACVEYLADLGRSGNSASAGDRSELLDKAFTHIGHHERKLSEQLLNGLNELPAYRTWGITDPSQLDKRVPTFSLTHSTQSPQQLAERLAQRSLWAWAGNHYAVPFTEAAGLEPEGTLRIGLLHYNTSEEVDRLLEGLAEIA